MAVIQYDFFEKKGPIEPDEAYEMRSEMRHLIESTGKVRRGMFARLNEQSKILGKALELISNLEAQIEILKR